MAKRLTKRMMGELIHDKYRALFKGNYAEAADIAQALGEPTEEIERLLTEKIYIQTVKPRLEAMEKSARDPGYAKWNKIIPLEIPASFFRIRNPGR